MKICMVVTVVYLPPEIRSGPTQNSNFRALASSLSLPVIHAHMYICLNTTTVTYIYMLLLICQSHYSPKQKAVTTAVKYLWVTPDAISI